MDLSSIPTATLQQMQGQLAAALLSGQRLSAASYAQGNGSKSVSYLLGSRADMVASLTRVERELRDRGVISTRPPRRRIGIRF